MELSIEQLEQRIEMMQKTLSELKTNKLEVVREFTGQYFAPYQGKSFRRMESDGIPIWEFYIEHKKEWIMLDSNERSKLEHIYQKNYVSPKRKTPQEGLEEFME